MTKPARIFPRRLSELLGATLKRRAKSQGFASAEILALWADLAGPKSPPERADEDHWPRASRMPIRSRATSGVAGRGPSALEFSILSASSPRTGQTVFLVGWQQIGPIPCARRHLRPPHGDLLTPPPAPSSPPYLPTLMAEVLGTRTCASLARRGRHQSEMTPVVLNRPLRHLGRMALQLCHLSLVR